MLVLVQETITASITTQKLVPVKVSFMVVVKATRIDLLEKMNVKQFVEHMIKIHALFLLTLVDVRIHSRCGIMRYTLTHVCHSSTRVALAIQTDSPSRKTVKTVVLYTDKRRLSKFLKEQLIFVHFQLKVETAGAERLNGTTTKGQDFVMCSRTEVAMAMKITLTYKKSVFKLVLLVFTFTIGMFQLLDRARQQQKLFHR